MWVVSPPQKSFFLGRPGSLPLTWIHKKSHEYTNCGRLGFMRRHSLPSCQSPRLANLRVHSRLPSVGTKSRTCRDPNDFLLGGARYFCQPRGHNKVAEIRCLEPAKSRRSACELRPYPAAGCFGKSPDDTVREKTSGGRIIRIARCTLMVSRTWYPRW